MKIFWLVQKFGGNTPEKRVYFVGWLDGWMVGWLDGWMVQKFSSTLRIEMDPRPELREVKPSLRSELKFLCFFEKKNVNFLNLPNYLMFYQNCSKSQFYYLKIQFLLFFFKKQGCILRFFPDFHENSKAMIIDQNLKKN